MVRLLLSVGTSAGCTSVTAFSNLSFPPTLLVETSSLGYLQCSVRDPRFYRQHKLPRSCTIDAVKGSCNLLRHIPSRNREATFRA